MDGLAEGKQTEATGDKAKIVANGIALLKGYTPRLERWNFGNNYAPGRAKAGLARIIGECFDDPRRPYPGSRIVSSNVIQLNLEEAWCRTENTTYLLGEIHEGWIKWIRDHELWFESFGIS